MSTAFPLLSLPHLAFEHVHQYFKISELIHLSQCSKRVKNIAKSFASPREGTVLKVLVGGKFAVIDVQWKNEERFCWRISLKEDFVLAEVEELTEQQIAGVTWKMAQVKKGLLSTPEEGRFEEDILFVVNLFKDLFKCEIATLELCFDRNCNFDKLLVASETLHRAKKIFIMCVAFTHSEMRFLLDNFVTEDLCIGRTSGLDFIYDKPLNYPIILVPEATWITGDKLLEMSDSCRKIELWSACLISNEDLNQLIKRWLSGTNKTLKLMEIQTTPSYSMSRLPSLPTFHDLDRQKILNGLPTIPGAKKRRDASKYYYEYHHYERGMDVRRADGVMATVIVHQGRYTVPQFSFIVWSDPNPNFSE